MRHLPPSIPDPNVLVGLDAPDDAGVYRLSDDVALVQTVDFFTPIVDDPYAFGQIAAANALSDVYAMGGRPLSCLNIVGFPVNKLPAQVLADILRGGADKVREAGAVIIGGHSVDDAEPKYGLAVLGIVHPQRLLTKAGARPGDVLVLTKPIGVGAITTAIKRGLASDDEIEEVVDVMRRLNNVTDVLHRAGVRAATDITGFGLLGHAAEMARESRVALRISAGQVPVLPAAYKYAEQNVFPGGSRANRRFVEPWVTFSDAVPEPQRMILCDAVTSGGLLIACPPAELEQLLAGLRDAGTISQAVIGQVEKGPAGHITVEP
ncbi:MAG: selenide, water dikinase SelD [Limnochordales bacterium]